MAAVSGAAAADALLPAKGAPNTPGMDAEYANYALAQRFAARGLLSSFRDALRALLTDTNALKPLRIVELGVADGCNTDLFIDALLECMTAAPSQRAVELLLLDVPSSPHWTTLARRVEAWTAQAARAGVTLVICMQPGSFYAPFAAAGSIDLLYACTVLHWSAGGIVTPADFAAVGYDFWFTSPPSEARAHFEARMTRDLDCILRNVHAALRPGGRFLATTPSRVEPTAGVPMKHWYKRGLIALYAVMRSVGAAAYVPSTNSATVEEWMQAFDRGAAAGVGFADVDVTCVDIPDEYWTRARDAAEYGRTYSRALEAVVGPIVARMRHSHGVDDAAFWTSVADSMAAQYAAAAEAGTAPEEVGVSTVLRATRAPASA